MSLQIVLLAALAFPLGFGAGTVLRGAFVRSRTTVTVLILASLLPWFAHHGRVLNALRFGAVQSQWTYPTAFSWVHGVGYTVAAAAALMAVLLSTRTRWALVFAPGLAFLGTLFVTLPLARRAVSEGYFLLSVATTSTFWVGTLVMTALLLGYCRKPNGFARASVAPAGLQDTPGDGEPK